jgi:hypothetical protein
MDKKLFEALRKKHGKDNVLGGGSKGGFFIKGHGHITVAKARKSTGVETSVKRSRKKKSHGYGDMGFLSRMV